MTPDDPSSFDAVLAGLGNGDQDAARHIYEKFIDALIRLATRNLGRGSRTDPESVAQSVFLSFFTRQRRGEYQLYNWAMVYGLLAHITFRKCLNRVRFHRQQRREPTEPVVTFEDWQKVAAGPGPDDEAMLAELLGGALAAFNADDRAIIDAFMAGESVAKIAERVGLSTRTVQRVVEEFRDGLLALLDRE